MPWDQRNVRSWELTKAAPKIGLSAYRSGLYKRAIVVLQDQSYDSAGRASTAHSLQRVLSNAHANYTDCSLAPPEQAETNGAGQEQQSSSERKVQKQNDHAKLLMQHLRRQRQQQRHEQNKRLWQHRHEQKVKLRQEQLELQIKQQRQQQDQALLQLEQQKQSLWQKQQQHKQESAAITEALKSKQKSLVAAPLEKLSRIQEKKAAAEDQLAKASLAGEHMSRRAASIEPEDGECTPSPSAVEELQNAARQQVGAHPPVMQALPPPPPTVSIRFERTFQVKVIFPRPQPYQWWLAGS
ncbi:hypothetical protein ABBQ32_003447 [Trebouxia sp. C0010 RCD-2024]